MVLRCSECRGEAIPPWTMRGETVCMGCFYELCE